jgi:hypothetical protein
MTKDYSKGKVYKIEPIVEHEEGDIYIGSTTKDYLSQRMTAHRSDYNRWKNGDQSFVRSYELFDKYGLGNCRIILLEAVEAKSLDELHAREGHYIKSLKCVNKQIMTRTKNEWYNENFKDIQAKKEIYRKQNKDKIKKRKEKYYESRKELLTTVFTCCCGAVIQLREKTPHQKTKKHQNFVQQNINI